jgi:hypothetical protein
MYVYKQSESSRETGTFPLYTVGYYDPEGKWQPESDHGGEKGKDDAALRVAFLNGEPIPPRPRRPGRTKDGQLVQRIIRHLNGKQWNADAMQRVVDEIRDAGYRVLDWEGISDA